MIHSDKFQNFIFKQVSINGINALDISVKQWQMAIQQFVKSQNIEKFEIKIGRRIYNNKKYKNGDFIFYV